MSNPDQIQSPAGEAKAGEVHPPERSVDQPMVVAMAIGQLRTLVCGLGVALLVVSLALSAYVLKQNRNLSGDMRARQTQISQLQANRQQITYALNELAKYSVGKPELTALFAKHGIQITSTPAATESAPTPSTQ